MTLHDVAIRTIDGRETTLGEFSGRVILIVNVASKCGFTPQYAQLEELYRQYADQGFTVLGVPSNQFGKQEPGSADEIVEFCSTTYGVTFPLLEKSDVNGGNRHPLYAELVKTPFADGSGAGGDVDWNFEKFVVSPAGEVVSRFMPEVSPDDPEVILAIKSQLPS